MVMSIMMIFALPAYAEGTCEITISPDFAAIEAIRGGSKEIELGRVFNDSKGHVLSYKVDEADDSLKVRIKDGMLLLDPLELGSYEIKITASCDETGNSRQITVPVEIVESEDEGNPAQYGYDETPAESVSVYLSMSSDGVPLVGNDSDNTVMSHLKINVPYFDLGLYGLERYYRYHTENGKGKYIDEEVVERPTTMHLFIYITERYYMGLPEAACGKGTSGILEYNTPTAMMNLYGDIAYTGKLRAYTLTGGACSSYMTELWGHNENLMYYRNHLYPLMSAGWGATSDYMLLSDGNTIDVGMFTNPGFYMSGAFCCFDKETYEIQTGRLLGLLTQYASSSQFGSSMLKPIKGLIVDVYDDEWNKVTSLSSENAGYSYVFNEPGKYHLLGRGSNAGSTSCSRIPAASDVIVTDSFADYEFDRITDQDGNLIPFIDSMEDIPDMVHYNIAVPDGTFSVNIRWPELSDCAFKEIYYDFNSGEVVQSEGLISRTDNTLTFDPAKWKNGEKAAVVTDEQGTCLGAFTFSFRDPESVNFAPRLKDGVRPSENVSWREKKNYSLKMSDLFVDPEGEAMTYKVSVDGADEENIDNNYSFNISDLGKHVLVFTPQDIKGEEGETYTLNLTINTNKVPELKDKNASSSEASVRYDEKASLDLSSVFRDADKDELSYLMSTDGETYTHIDTTSIDNKQYFEFMAEDENDTGAHVFRFKACDDLNAESDIYTYTVNVVEDQAPVPAIEEMTDYCMLNHLWIFDYYSRFSDPEGDLMTYTVSIDGAAPLPCNKNTITGDDWAHDFYLSAYEMLVDQDKKYEIVFYATDKYGKTGSLKVNVYATPEEVKEIQIQNNRFDACKDGKAVYDAGLGSQATWITDYLVSRNVTLRDVKYSEYKGHYNYYLDIDDLGIENSDTFTLTINSTAPSNAEFRTPGIDFDGYAVHDLTKRFVTLEAENGVKSTRIYWTAADGRSRYMNYRFTVNMITPEGNVQPEELFAEPQKEGLYVGESTDRTEVRCRYSDGITRYVDDAVITPASFSEAGSQELSVKALGLTATCNVQVKNIPAQMVLVDQMGKYGRLRTISVVDENDDPIDNAVITMKDPVTDPEYRDEYYDRGPRYKANLRQSRSIEMQLPAKYSPSKIKVLFEMLKDKDYTVDILDGDGVTYSSDGHITTGVMEIEINNSKGSGICRWYDCYSNMNTVYHSYDLFNVSVKTGVCKINGKVESWDDKDNTEFVVYPADMSDPDIREDVVAEREHALDTSISIEYAVKVGNRYQKAFKVEGLDAGTYKLAVVKPGKYVVTVVPFETDGTNDIGTLPLRLYGDINNDGLLDVRDVTQIARFGVGKRQFDEEENLAADVNMDKTVDVRDITQLCRKIVGKSSSLDKIS